MALSNEDVHEILRIIEETPLDELTIETEGFSLHVRKGSPDATSGPPPVSLGGRDVGSSTQPEAKAPESSRDGGVTIAAPMLGVFYRAPGPGKKPFVDVGNRVEPDTVVCIIEAMKMMNSVSAGVSGTIVEVCHENAELVEYDEPLFRVEPA
jgi:acetyl-CoA carboxylase biotin carboxyl carrier protein